MLKKLSCFALILLFVLSCAETQIENDMRVLIKGKIIDQDNNPVVNAHIEIYTDANETGAARVLLGEGISDQSGEFNVTSFFGSNALFYINIFADSQYSTYQYRTNTEEYTPNDLIFDLQTVELFKVSVFNYDIIRESGENNTLDYSFRYITPECLEIYDEGILNEAQSNCYINRLLTRSLNNLEPNAENKQLMVPFQSQIEFIYSINEQESISEIIDINSLDYEFQFSY